MRPKAPTAIGVKTPRAAKPSSAFALCLLRIPRTLLSPRAQLVYAGRAEVCSRLSRASARCMQRRRSRESRHDASHNLREVTVMGQQGQVFPLPAQGKDGTRWAYRYRLGGRGSRRLQRGGFASEQATAEALERVLEQLRGSPGGTT